MTEPPALDDWEPLSPPEAGALFRTYPGLWAIAGGWGIDLFIGTQTRPHADIDVQLDRRDSGLLHASLPGWLLYAAHGELTLWEDGSTLLPEIHNMWCRRPGHAWELQLMLGDFTETEWLYRRDHRIRGSRNASVLHLEELPIVPPEIQLLYKSRLPNQPKDEHDFALALPLLTPDRRLRLATSLRTLYGDHPWLTALDSARSA